METCTTIRSAFVLAALLGVAAPLSAGDDETAQLRQQIAELEARIAALEPPQDSWLDAQRTGEIRAIVRDVLADADNRANLLGSAMTAGHDGGFFIASPDGNFRLSFSGRFQPRFIYNHQSTPPPSPGGAGDRHRSGFEMRRMLVVFEGHVIDPSWQFKIQADFNRSTGEFTLLDAFLDKEFENEWALRIGQFRHQFLKEDNTSSGRQLAVERSLINARFAQNRSQGIELHGNAGDRLRFALAFTEGIISSIGDAGRGRNTPFDARTTEFALTGRVEYLAVGDAPNAWRQFRQFTSWQDEPLGILLGAAAHWQRDEYGTPDDVTEMFRWTVDAMVKFGSANAFVAFIGNHEDQDNGPSVDQYALLVQGGVFIVPDQWEVFTRYEWGDADQLAADLSVLTVGVNRYFHRHDVKWTTDVGIGLNEVAPFWAASSAGYRADAPGEDGQIVVRSQLQLQF